MRLDVTLKLPSGETRLVKLPADVIAGRLLPALLSKLELPLVDEAGHALRYELIGAAGPIDPERTLTEAGVKADAQLMLAVGHQTWFQGHRPVVSSPEPTVPEIRIGLADLSPPRPADSGSRRQEGQARQARPDRAWRRNVGLGLGLATFLIIFTRILGGWGSLGLKDGDMIAGLAVTEAVATSEQIARGVTATPVVTLPAPTSAPARATATTTAAQSADITGRDRDAIAMVTLGDNLYFLRAVPGSLTLWEVKGRGAEQQLMRLQGSATGLRRELLVIENELYFWSGQEPLLWRYNPESEVFSLAGFTNPPTTHIPVQIGRFSLYTEADADEPQPLLMVRFPGQQAIELPVRVDQDWYKNQTVLYGILYFNGYSAETGYELWRTDGTIAGTWLVRDLVTGPRSSGPAVITRSDDRIHFVAADGAGGLALWRSQGNYADTDIVTALPQSQAAIRWLAATSVQLYFIGEHEDGSEWLWVYDIAAAEFQPIGPLGTQIIQLAAEPEAVYVLAWSESDGGSVVGWGQAEADTFAWVASAPGGVVWREMYASATQLLLLDNSGAPYQLLPGLGQAQPVVGVGQVAQVYAEADGSFLMVTETDSIWRLTASSPQATLVFMPGESGAGQ
ncbi:MAG: hypothetical protein H6651_16735 [Ardenticatenales bacterium]|nr:hypothetical protein [Ardenticatenales bacterium]